MRVIGPRGEQFGIVPLPEALRLAQEHTCDLVEVAPRARPPACKLMDYEKWRGTHGRGPG